MPRKTAAERAAEQAADTRANMADDQTAPGFEEPGDAEDDLERNPTPIGRALARRRGGEAEQGSYVPPAPGEAQPGFISPPALEQFSNATYLEAGPEVRAMVERVLDFEEFSELRGIPYITLWRRKGKPMLSSEDGDRKYAGCSLTDPLDQWITHHLEVPGYPHYVLNLYWLHFDELRGESSYLHEQMLERHIFMALQRVAVSESGVLGPRTLTYEMLGDVVKRYGMFVPGLRKLHRQLALWAHDDDGEE